MLKNNGPKLPLVALVVAGFFLLTTLSLSTFLIVEHLSAFKKPEEQTWIIGVIIMVPIYAVDSFISLWEPKLSMVCEILRNCYEAYAIYSFGCYLIACLGGESRVIEKLEAQAVDFFDDPSTPLLGEGDKELGYGATVHEDEQTLLSAACGCITVFFAKHSTAASRQGEIRHPIGLDFCLDPWIVGDRFYRIVKVGIVQYVILKTLCAVLSLILELHQVYGNGEFRWDRGYPYISFVMNFSQMWAMYCLVQFYMATREFLAPIKPIGKFMCIKAVIFMTWWQGLFIAFFFSLGIVTPLHESNSGKLQTELQDLLICIEMSVAAAAHLYVFPATPYQNLRLGCMGEVRVLRDYAGGPPDVDEVLESEKPAFVKWPMDNPMDCNEGPPSFSESVSNMLVGGSNTVVKDVKFTVSQAVEPVERARQRLQDGIGAINSWSTQLKMSDCTLWQESKDDSWIGMNADRNMGMSPVRGIDDPMLHGSQSDSGILRASRRLRTGLLHGHGSLGRSAVGRGIVGQGLEPRPSRKGRSQGKVGRRDIEGEIVEIVFDSKPPLRGGRGAKR